MRKKYFFATLLAALLSLTVSAQIQQPRIAVLDFSAGAKIEQEDINGISALFNTFFEPEGYTIVERTRVSRILEEQNIQVDNITEEQRVRLGEILNVKMIVIGDVNYAMRQYNVDVRVVDVETGTIVAKDGAEWKKGRSYRKMMKRVAKRLSKDLKIEPEDEPDTIFYRPTGGSIRFAIENGVAFDDYLISGASVAYNHQITPYFMIGGGFGRAVSKGQYTGIWRCPFLMCIPIYVESEIRTPRYKWSLFTNLKVGVSIYDDNCSYFTNLTFGGSYKNLNLGVGIGTWGFDIYPIFTLSYNLPINTIIKGLF